MKLLRTNIWWNAVVPQILGWVYFALLADEGPLNRSWELPILFFVATISIAAFGYLLNDFFDIVADAIAGKKNALASFSAPVRVVFVTIPLLIGIAAWLPFIDRVGATILLTLQIVALILYSAPPFRLKNCGLAGVLTDAFYGHINPVFITLAAFIPYYIKISPSVITFFAILFLAVMLKGIRNILLHQIDDRKKDKRAGTATFVVKKGALFSLNLVNRLLPFEIALTALLALFISYYLPPFFLSLFLFTILTYLKFSGWKLAYLPKRQLKFKFLHFINDYYEGWLPVFFLILLAIKHHSLAWLLPTHLILFPAFITKLVTDLKTIAQNFKTEDDY